VALAVAVKLLRFTHDSSYQLLKPTHYLKAIVFYLAREILAFFQFLCIRNLRKRCFFPFCTHFARIGEALLQVSLSDVAPQLVPLGFKQPFSSAS
ncbi:MAG: hypothetical protein Q4B54_02835, partial [Coriobacteriales bacterium]|nr:hypothetical protein [Coriobacteriales bacterium]